MLSWCGQEQLYVILCKYQKTVTKAERLERWSAFYRVVWRHQTLPRVLLAACTWWRTAYNWYARRSAGRLRRHSCTVATGNPRLDVTLLLWRWTEEEMGGGSQKKRRMWKNWNKKSVEAFKTFCMICRAVGHCRLASVWGCRLCGALSYVALGGRKRERFFWNYCHWYHTVRICKETKVGICFSECPVLFCAVTLVCLRNSETCRDNTWHTILPLFQKFLCCSMYCLFCVVLRTVCV
jgi:hypothetical protein